MSKVVGFKELLDVVSNKNKSGMVVSDVQLVGGVSKLRFGLFCVKHPEKGVVYESYGLKEVINYLQCNQGCLDDGYVFKYVGINAQQESVCEFLVEFKEGEVIQSQIKLKTDVVGERSICGQGCDIHKEGCHGDKSNRVGDNESEAHGGEKTNTEETQNKEADTTNKGSETKSEPDFEYASTLTKSDLDTYAKGFGINLDQRKSKGKMLSTFKAKYGEAA